MKKSKKKKGAVKFGDKLPVYQCKEIIKGLSKCKLPFQCAHGRPTVLPLTNILYTTVNFICILAKIGLWETSFVFKLYV